MMREYSWEAVCGQWLYSSASTFGGESEADEVADPQGGVLHSGLNSKVDAQSAQIERLYQENAGLAAAVKETSAVCSRWEAQVESGLATNEELRATAEELRRQHGDLIQQQGELHRRLQAGPVPGAESSGDNALASEEENARLRSQLLETQGQLAELQASLLRTKADYTSAVQRLASLRRLYKPVLSGIEYKLLQCKNDMTSASLRAAASRQGRLDALPGPR